MSKRNDFFFFLRRTEEGGAVVFRIGRKLQEFRGVQPLRLSRLHPWQLRGVVLVMVVRL